MKKQTAMGRVALIGAIVVLALVVGSLVSSIGPLRDLYDELFNRQTYTATGDVVLKRLKEQKSFVAASGTFEVPVVVCNGTPEAYDLENGKLKDRRTPAQQLLESCNGAFEEKATVLVSSEVQAVVDLEKLGADAIQVDGSRVVLDLPEIELERPAVDAERGVSLIAKDGSFPLVGGDLPDDYQARAAGSAKDAISGIASESNLLEIGSKSVQSWFDNLLKGLGFTDVTVTIGGKSETAG